MLVLTRKVGQSLYLYLDGALIATVMVTAVVDGTKARIGIEAPPDVQVSRFPHENGNGVFSVNRPEK